MTLVDYFPRKKAGILIRDLSGFLQGSDHGLPLSHEGQAKAG
jgi:phosphatidate phosphatase APP1